jgi:hypothetical protein
MNFKKTTRNALMLCFFLLLFAIRPGFGKLNLENCDIERNRGWNRLTEEIQHFEKVNCGFELHCEETPAKETVRYAEESKGLLSRDFLE